MPKPRKKMLLVFNPVAGQGEFAANLFEIIDRFTRNGFEVTLYPTADRLDAYNITLERGTSFSHIICAGGDGTLNEVISALMRMSKKPLLGYIPSGTTNDFAFTHKLENDVLLGTKAIIGGAPASIDIGGFQDGFFTYVAAFGLFTDVAYGTPQNMKNMLGHTAYILEGMKKLGNIRRMRCMVQCDGETIEGDFILGMVTNTRSVGGFRLPAETDVRFDDGLFEVILLRDIHRFSELNKVISFLLGTGEISSSFIMRSARRVSVYCDTALDWSIDGEYGGSHHKTEITVHQNAIRLIKKNEPPPQTPPKGLVPL